MLSHLSQERRKDSRHLTSLAYTWKAHVNLNSEQAAVTVTIEIWFQKAVLDSNVVLFTAYSDSTATFYQLSPHKTIKTKSTQMF